MLHLTKQEKIVLLSLTAVIICGSVINYLFKKYPGVDKTISSPQRFVLKTNINTATKDELVRVPYIGEKGAQAIITYRRENGNFRTVDDLCKVPGIFWKNYVKMRPYLVL
ncbi:MAG: helix-hairpin-helix domain-containing protein [Candidatus Omnitrophica bacterium]|nr:helix-hairpin-helix domain-containing protein [Candidatus Omnitrophota bacterium]